MVSVAFLVGLLESRDGVNVTGIVQLAPGARPGSETFRQPMFEAVPTEKKLLLSGASAKSTALVPVIFRSETTSGLVPMFVNTTFDTRLCVLVIWSPKVRGFWPAGDIDTCGAVAVPLRFTVSVCGAGLAPTVYVTVNCPVFAPGEVGLKVIDARQLLPGDPAGANGLDVQDVEPSSAKSAAFVPVIAFTLRILIVDAVPFPIVTWGTDCEPTAVVTFRGFGTASSELLPAPLTAMESGLFAAPVYVTIMLFN